MVSRFDVDLMQDGIFVAKHSNISCDQADSMQETFANNDLYFLVSRSEICHWAGDYTLYFCGQALENTLCNLKHDLHNILIRFQQNSLKLNLNKTKIKRSH